MTLINRNNDLILLRVSWYDVHAPTIPAPTLNSVSKRYIQSAYHLNGIFGNSGENSNGTVHPVGMFSGKR